MRAKPEPPRFSKVDRRLLGTWKSDKRRTFAEWNWKRNTSPKKKANLKAFFGKLEITYTRTKIITVLPHRKSEWARRYAVLGTDDESVAVVQFGEIDFKNRRKYDPENLKMVDKMFGSKPRIQQINFDKKHFWFSLGNGRNREFFRKIRNGK
jgi:hypothetical protein